MAGSNVVQEKDSDQVMRGVVSGNPTDSTRSVRLVWVQRCVDDCIPNFPFGAGELRWVTKCGDKRVPRLNPHNFILQACHPAVFGLVLGRSRRLGMQ